MIDNPVVAAGWKNISLGKFDGLEKFARAARRHGVVKQTPGKERRERNQTSNRTKIGTRQINMVEEVAGVKQNVHRQLRPAPEAHLPLDGRVNRPPGQDAQERVARVPPYRVGQNEPGNSAWPKGRHLQRDRPRVGMPNQRHFLQSKPFEHPRHPGGASPKSPGMRNESAAARTGYFDGVDAVMRCKLPCNPPIRPPENKRAGDEDDGWAFPHLNDAGGTRHANSRGKCSAVDKARGHPTCGCPLHGSKS
jgi:hypothetical protein